MCVLRAEVQEIISESMNVLYDTPSLRVTFSTAEQGIYSLSLPDRPTYDNFADSFDK